MRKKTEYDKDDLEDELDGFLVDIVFTAIVLIAVGCLVARFSYILF